MGDVEIALAVGQLGALIARQVIELLLDEFLQVAAVGGEPLAVGLGLHQIAVDVVAGEKLALLQIGGDHLPALQATPFTNLLGGDVQHPVFAGHQQPVVGGK